MPAPPAATPPPPPAPVGVDKATWEILAALCPVATYRGPDGKLVQGCRSWPPWEAPEARPDGLAPRASGYARQLEWDVKELKAAAFLRYVTRYRGAFTRTGADELLLFFEDCRLMEGITITGCAAIVERRDDAWKVVTTHRSAAFENCVVNRRADDRDLLVCHNSTGAALESILVSAFYLDFSKPDGFRRSRFAQLAFNAFDIPCEIVPPAGSSGEAYGFWTSGLVDLEIKKIASKDVDRDGDEDVTFDLERAYLPYSPAVLSRIRHACRVASTKVPAEGYAAVDELLPKPTRFQLQFRNDGEGLVPTQGTARVMKVWQKQLPPRNYHW